MKSKSTWIAIACVASALFISQLYSVSKDNRTAKREITTVSEIKPETTQAPTPAKLPLKTEQAEPTAMPVTAPAPKEKADTPKESATPKEPSFLLPSSGNVSQPYSKNDLVYFAPLKTWRCHLGMDFTPLDSENVLAVYDGTVSRVYEDYLYGKTVLLEHGDGLVSIYASLKEPCVSAGDKVAQGTVIGYMGESAPAEAGVHLHFAMQKNGQYIDPFSEKS